MRVTIFSTGRKFRPVLIFTQLHALTLVVHSYALLLHQHCFQDPAHLSMVFSIDRMLGVGLGTVLTVKNLIGSCSAVGLQSYDPVNRVVTWNVRIVIYMCTLYNLPLILGLRPASSKEKAWEWEGSMTASWLFLQIGKIQPQKYLSLSGSVSSLKREGRGGVGGGRERDRKQYSYLQTRSS